ncbi:MAG: DcaP family trimeric outer membrane transporter, partial [Pseudomonadota bacterium]
MTLPRLLGGVAAALLANNALASCPAADSAAGPELYPTASVLPENLLRVYVYFPRPMGPDVSASDVLLLGPDGDAIPGAFLPTRFGLWSPDRRRLTVLLDPGRVKTGLEANNALGRALQAGSRYAVRVPGTLRDAEGCPLGEDAVFEFTAGPSDDETPAPETWQLTLPSAGTREELAVDLGSTHDHVSMAYRLRVLTAQGKRVGGSVSLAQAERVWQFIPSAPWSSEPYQVIVDPQLEDLAGNRPGVVFDRDLDAPIREWTNTLTFTPISRDEELATLKAQMAILAARVESQSAEIEALKARVGTDADTEAPAIVATETARRQEIGRVPDNALVRAGDFGGSIVLPGTTASVRIGGYVQADIGYDFDNLGFSDALNVRSVPLDDTTSDGEQVFRSHARNSRVNIDVRDKTPLGDFRTFVEFDFFGSGSTFTNNYSPVLRHAAAGIGNLYFGQYWSQFTDLAAFPEGTSAPLGQPL